MRMKGGKMSLAELTQLEEAKSRAFNRTGRCELYCCCESYTPNDSICNRNRELAYRKLGLPTCYRPLTSKNQ